MIQNLFYIYDEFLTIDDGFKVYRARLSRNKNTKCVDFIQIVDNDNVRGFYCCYREEFIVDSIDIDAFDNVRFISSFAAHKKFERDYIQFPFNKLKRIKWLSDTECLESAQSWIADKSDLLNMQVYQFEIDISFLDDDISFPGGTVEMRILISNALMDKLISYFKKCDVVKQYILERVM